MLSFGYGLRGVAVAVGFIAVLTGCGGSGDPAEESEDPPPTSIQRFTFSSSCATQEYHVLADSVEIALFSGKAVSASDIDSALTITTNTGERVYAKAEVSDDGRTVVVTTDQLSGYQAYSFQIAEVFAQDGSLSEEFTCQIFSGAPYLFIEPAVGLMDIIGISFSRDEVFFSINPETIGQISPGLFWSKDAGETFELLKTLDRPLREWGIVVSELRDGYIAFYDFDGRLYYTADSGETWVQTPDAFTAFLARFSPHVPEYLFYSTGTAGTRLDIVTGEEVEVTGGRTFFSHADTQYVYTSSFREYGVEGCPLSMSSDGGISYLVAACIGLPADRDILAVHAPREDEPGYVLAGLQFNSIVFWESADFGNSFTQVDEGPLAQFLAGRARESWIRGRQVLALMPPDFGVYSCDLLTAQYTVDGGRTWWESKPFCVPYGHGQNLLGVSSEYAYFESQFRDGIDESRRVILRIDLPGEMKERLQQF